jgi:hypothetical protein
VCRKILKFVGNHRHIIVAHYCRKSSNISVTNRINSKKYHSQPRNSYHQLYLGPTAILGLESHAKHKHKLHFQQSRSKKNTYSIHADNPFSPPHRCLCGPINGSSSNCTSSTTTSTYAKIFSTSWVLFVCVAIQGVSWHLSWLQIFFSSRRFESFVSPIRKKE